MKFNALSDKGKLVFFFLLTHPHMTPLGAMRGSIQGFAAELQWTEKAFRKAFQEVLSKGMAKHDERAFFVRLPNFIKHNPPESPNVIKAWEKCFEDIPECTEKALMMQEVEGYVEGLSKGFQEAFREGIAKAMPNQEQDQEQEQDITPSYPPQGGEGVSKPEPTKSRKPKKPNGKLSKAQQALFDRFWENYPNRKSKGQAMTAWKKIDPDEQLVEAMISKIKQAKTSDAWVKERGRFIPHPATWLNAMGWEDEYNVNDNGKEGPGNEFSGKKYTGTPISEIPWIGDENV